MKKSNRLTSVNETINEGENVIADIEDKRPSLGAIEVEGGSSRRPPDETEDYGVFHSCVQ